MVFKKKKQFRSVNAVQMLALGFAGIILLGGSLLTLPFFSRSGTFTPFIDAVFTATSATCVTGLTTLNTAEHWNTAGHFLIMCLIETGGLGFMMLPILFFAVSKRKVGLSTRIVLREALNLDDMSGVMSLMLYILKFAIVIQLLGVAALAIAFVPQYGYLTGLWYALFHAVSAFCNAGFDLFGDSLVPFQQNSYVILVISFLIIAGGLGFIVWRDLLHYRERRRLSLHSKIALTVTVALLVIGTLVFFITEKNSRDLVSGANQLDRFINTIFMSVTPRTAGYYSIDYLQMSHAGLLFTIILMFIGGTSGSTAGGLKTTTFGVLIFQVYCMLRGRSNVEFGGRTIRPRAVNRALTLFFISFSLCTIVTMILSVTEKIQTESGIEYIAFEVFSAFGTVGLTMGLTPELSVAGKILISFLMYIGRVGIMTVAFSLAARLNRQEAKFKYPEEGVMIG